MALNGSEWAVVAGVFGIIVAVIMINGKIAGNATLGGKTKGKEDGPSVDPMLSRFVVHEGSVVGEVLAIDGDNLIVKQKGEYNAIPASIASLKNEEVHLSGETDWSGWSAAGQAWLATNRQGQNDEITAHLTRSEDIKAPARQAFAERQDEEE